MSRLRLALMLAVAIIAAPAMAQTVTVATPNTVNPSGQPSTVNKTFIVNPDGTIATVSSSSGSVVAKGSPTLATAQVSIGTTATLVAAARSSRARIVITQATAGPCYFGPANTVSATTGARLTAAGASKVYVYAGALYGICPGGAVTVDTDEEF